MVRMQSVYQRYRVDSKHVMGLSRNRISGKAVLGLSKILNRW